MSPAKVDVISYKSVDELRAIMKTDPTLTRLEGIPRGHAICLDDLQSGAYVLPDGNGGGEVFRVKQFVGFTTKTDC